MENTAKTDENVKGELKIIKSEKKIINSLKKDNIKYKKNFLVKVLWFLAYLKTLLKLVILKN